MKIKDWKTVLAYARNYYVAQAQATPRRTLAEARKLARLGFPSNWPMKHRGWIFLPCIAIDHGTIGGRTTEIHGRDVGDGERAQTDAYLRDCVEDFEPAIHVALMLGATLCQDEHDHWLARLDRDPACAGDGPKHVYLSASLWVAFESCDGIYMLDDSDTSPIIGRAMGRTTVIAMPVRQPTLKTT